MLSCSPRRILKKVGEHDVFANRAANPTSQGLGTRHCPVFLTPRNFADTVCERLPPPLVCRQYHYTVQAEDQILRRSAIIVLDRNRSGSDRKPWLKTRPKYSDEPSYRIRQNLQIRSERLRSMLRKVDRVLADSTSRQP